MKNAAFLPYIGLLLMIAGIIATYLTRKIPRRVIIWSIIFTLFLQTASFFTFSRMLHKNFGIAWLACGLIIGGILGLLSHFEKKGSIVLYKQNTVFCIVYFSLLLINQFIAIFFNSFIPVMLYISSLALGLQLGMNIVVILKANKLKKIVMSLIILCFSMFAVLGTQYAFAADETNKFTKNPQGLAVCDITNTEFEIKLPSGKTANIPIKIFVGSYYPEINNIIFAFSQTSGYAGEETKIGTYEWFLMDLTQASGKQLVEYDSKGAFETTKSIKFEIKEVVGKDATAFIWKDNTYTDEWTIGGKVDEKGCEFRITQQDGHFQDYFVEYPEGYFKGRATQNQNDNTSTPTQTPANESSDQPQENNQDDNGGSIFTPQPLNDKDADNAAAASGIIGGLAALFGAAAAAFGKGMNLVPLTNGTPADDPLPEQNNNINESDFDEPDNSSSTSFTPMPPTPPAPPSPPSPRIGERRADGKIYTKNNGWQNENYPEMNINSINNVINNLEDDMKRYEMKGDNLRYEIAKDELKKNQRELKEWTEDNLIVKRAQTNENADMYQKQGKVWNDRSDSLETAANAANTISFASDLALAVGSAGTLTALSGCAKTLKVLTTAKDLAGMGADAYDDYKKGRDLTQIALKQVAKKTINKAVGLEFDKGKTLYSIDGEQTSRVLKGLVAAGETGAGNVITDTADNMGILNNFSKGGSNILGGGSKNE